MDQGLLPRRYAKATLELADEKGTAADVYSALTALNAAFAAEPGLQKALENPHVAPAQKEGLVETALGGKDTPGAETVRDLVRLMERNHRLALLQQTALAYVGLYRAERKIFSVEITSAAPLEPSELQRIQTLVKNHLPAGSTAEFAEAVDPELIGGFTVKVGNDLLDASVANDLKQLRLKLLSH